MKKRLTEIVRVRLTTEELAQVQELARENSRTVSNQMRLILLVALDDRAHAERDGRELMDRLDQVTGRARMVGR
jgi:hypothetical protein